jgi:Holliday junction resolvase-like predicted endonuclease
MAMYGYGEDALTYWALTERMAEILEKLHDGTRAEDATTFYRPSFGRGVGGSFGEFDAIIATAERIYLIETKWNRSGEVAGKTELTIRKQQLRRHQVLEWYFDTWRAQRPASWDDFRARYQATFEAIFPELTIPAADTTLARTLQFVLKTLGGGEQRVRHVLLYIDIAGVPCPSTDGLPGFVPVRLQFSDADRSGFFPFAGIAPPARVP